MSNFNVPTRDEVSENNQAIFDNLERCLVVPNIYAAMGHSKMPWVVTCNFRGCDLIKQQRKVVNLAVSQLNGCKYNQAAHTDGKMSGARKLT
jgi:uncharacterized protein YjbI with pentapeptide repeats